MSGRYHGESSDSRNKFIHQVFLSFRGEDVRNGFVGHLFNGLRREGFRVFMDNDGLEHGRDIQIKLQEAIESSKVSIVTLSPHYADSRWCLDELDQIIKLNNVSTDRFVLPVFFDMEPTDVRHQTGFYGEYFEAHVKRFEGKMDMVDSWRRALKKVADLKGPSLKDANRDESQLVQNIIKEVRKMLPIQKLVVPPNIIGVDSIVRDICDWIKDGSQDVGVGVIHGQGGIGKTTIAQIVFNANSNDFDGSSFLEDIARDSKQDNGLIHFQRKLISHISGYKVGEIYCASEGMAKIRDVLGPKRVLLVLDDVLEMEHLGGLLDHPEWFCPGSKIIITTRNQQLQKKIRLFQREFEVHTLNKEESTELFSLLVFDQALPLKGYEEVSYRFVEYSGGLPLALCILGPLLRGEEDIEIWEDNLQSLEKYPDGKIYEVLKLSFDSLKNDDERNLFLHIAFFFVGRDEEYAFKILKACGVYTKAGFHNLVNRYLVSVTVSGKRLIMHQLIQEMGREIVRKESAEPGLRSRLWDHKETLCMLQKNKGTTSVKGLKLAFPAPKCVIFKENHFQPVSSGVGLASILSPTPLPRVASNLESIQTDAFAKLENLNLLELSYVQLKGGYADFPKEIKWLQWRGCPLPYIPKDLELCEMAVLDMQNSHLIQAWEDNKLLGALRILNLSYSLCLRSTPDLSNANGLERIDLEGCVNLVEIHGSIGSLRNLYYLNLKGCKNLRRLPTIDKLDSIKEVNLSGCCGLFALHTLTESFIILASNMNQKVSRSRFSSINLFLSLVKLNLSNCGISHDDVFDSLSGLSSLKTLYLADNPIITIRKDLRTLPRLRKLILDRCMHLQLISQLPGRVCLFVDACPSLERIEYHENPYAEDGYVRALDCPKLAAIENVLMLEHITKLDADKAKYLGYSKLESFQSSTLLAGGDVDNGLFKGVYQCGIYSIFLDGDRLLEDWFTMTNLGSEILYTVPRLPKHPIRAFNVCCMFECGSGIVCRCRIECGRGIECGTSRYIRFRGHLQIENLTTMRKWLYYPAVFPIYHKLIEGIEITWLTHWSVMPYRDVKAGDELKVSFELSEDVPIKCGINIVYEVDEEETDIETSNSYPRMSDNCLASVYRDIFRTVDLSEFERQHEPGTYILGGVVDTRTLKHDRPIGEMELRSSAEGWTSGRMIEVGDVRAFRVPK